MTRSKLICAGRGTAIALLIAVCALPATASATASTTGDANNASCGGFPLTEASPGFRPYLPDCRAYELVTRFQRNGVDEGLNGVEVTSGTPSTSGEAVDWSGLGACCEAISGADNLYRSQRSADGWQTTSLTPAPSRPLTGLFEEQIPVFESSDLERAVFATPASFAAGDERAAGSEKRDLYLREGDGALTWLSQGPSGSGSGPYSATFDGATSDAGEVVFSSAEALTANATPLEEELNTPPQYLYARDVSAQSTSLVDVNDAGTLLSPFGASLGDAGLLNEGTLPSDYEGTSTHAVSADGSKIFFESPPGGARDLPEGVTPHLYMRDLADSATVAIDDPASSGSASFAGASSNGSLVFFTSDEGLAGASHADELYAFNTTGETIGAIPPMSAAPISAGEGGLEPTTTLTAEAKTTSKQIIVASTTGFVAGHPVLVGGEALTIEAVLSATKLELTRAPGHTHAAGTEVVQQPDGVLGVVAIANDGSEVYFVANSVLTSGAGASGAYAQTGEPHAQTGEPNLYAYSTVTGRTTFIDTLAWTDVSQCEPDCAGGLPGVLVAEPDYARPAVPTPDGSVLVFASSGDLTGADRGPATTLTAAVSPGEHILTVASTAGFLVGHTIAVGTGPEEELDTIEAVDGPTQLTVNRKGSEGEGLYAPHEESAAVTQLHYELYRYEAAGGSIVCISCTPAGVTPTGSASLGYTGGGTYAPPDMGAAMSQDGSRIFFDSPDPLVPEAAPAVQAPIGRNGASEEPTNVYEWEAGNLYLISSGTATGAVLDGTTPSGDDVFFTTRAQLTGGQSDHDEGEGDENIYDARVGGGFPAAAVPAQCAESCRTQGAVTQFLSAPASTSLIGGGNLTPQPPAPSFTVAAVTAAQRAKLAASGRLTLSLSATASGKLVAGVFAKLHGVRRRVAYASVTLTKAGRVSLALKLDAAARAALAKSGRLTVTLEVSYSASATRKVAELNLRARTGRAAAAAVTGGDRTHA